LTIGWRAVGLRLRKSPACIALSTKRHDPAKIAPAGLLIALYLVDALARAVALSFGHGGQDGCPSRRRSARSRQVRQPRHCSCGFLRPPDWTKAARCGSLHFACLHGTPNYV
jgi:hypothetical protein